MSHRLFVAPFTGAINYSQQGAINNGCHETVNTGQFTETCANQFTSSVDIHLHGGIFTYRRWNSVVPHGWLVAILKNLKKKYKKNTKVTILKI